MLCTCIYFAENGSFDGEEIPKLVPHDPVVDPANDDQGMADAEDHHEVGARCSRHDVRYWMELGDQLNSLIIEAGIRPDHNRDIEVDDSLLKKWRGMLRVMYNLM